MNLDYRKGDIKLEDLNSANNYEAGDAFNQSQLANMLLVHHLSKLWADDNITVNGVSSKQHHSPGSINKSISIVRCILVFVLPT